MEILIKSFVELELEELYELLRLRSEVFVVEQECIYQDIDDKDKNAIHVIGKKNDKIVAYTRIFKPNDYFNNPSIGRVVVAKSYRKQELGKDIMLASIKAIESIFNTFTIELSAQQYLVQFYNDLNFKEEGDGYLEDGIPHIKMIRN
ncbi:GNAT family N-acetyltransferase [Croceitalea sp. MTPC9]|uniref:GNAT family N-acetyltransferase n=1 Tax=unclassified Croceitalea TaxID=2632280 RepID=UPI002B3F9215|nr:GNAT family N-acetyltransferase [Croceitalea sp. MTPC6]GMN16638.1 GNAT family N-acetyltransferase [Croceitalea sp. MTPC9]